MKKIQGLQAPMELTSTRTTTIEIDIRIMVREGKGQRIEITMIITNVVTLTGIMLGILFCFIK